jgi:hypothetical protein
MLRIDDQVTDSPGLVVHEDILDVTDLSVFRPDGVAHDRGRRLEVNVATVSARARLSGRTPHG